MADDVVSIRMRLTGGKEAAREAGLVRKEMGLLPSSARQAATGTTRATRGISRALGRMRGAWTAIKRAAKIGAVAAGAAVALLAVQLKKAVTETLDLSMTVAGLHRNLGLTHKSATGWATAAKARGIETTSLNMAFKTLSQQLLQAKRGSDTAKQAFGDVGVTMGDIKKHGGDVNGMLMILAKRFGNAEGGFKRQQAAGKLLGRGYQKLLPMFASGAEGLKEQLGWSEKYHVAQNLHIKDTQGLVMAQRESKAAWSGIQVALAAELMPALTAAHGEFQKLAAVLTDPKISREQKISIIGRKIKRGLTAAFDWVVNTGLPVFASRMGQAAPKVAAGFVQGFMRANTWGKLAMGTWLFAKLGGGQALAAVGGKAARFFGRQFIKIVGPIIVGTETGGGLLGSLGGAAKWKMVGGRAGRVFGKAFVLGAILALPLLAREIKKAATGDKDMGGALWGGSPFSVDLPGDWWHRGGSVNTPRAPWAAGLLRGMGAPAFATGGSVGTDDVPAVLKRREFVVNDRAAARHRGLLERINRGAPPLSPMLDLRGGGREVRQPIVLELDGRVLAETVVNLQEDAEARA